MPKSSNQKQKILWLMQMLLTQSDEGHPLTMTQIIGGLEQRGISAERKSVYADLEALRQFGLDIVQTKTRTTGYYIGAREFELPELKLLVDSVQSSKFITEKKTLALIRKIEGLASVYDAQLLQRQVYVRGRVKSMNESVYYNVDKISGAITADRRLHFHYFEYTVRKERRLRHGGREYEISPFALMWDNENYYMLGWDEAAGQLKHYRVDKMLGISTLPRLRQGKSAFAGLDMSSYSSKVFGMFTGTEQTVELRFAAELAGAVIDRFGKDVVLCPSADEQSFLVSLDVEVSPQFCAWLFAFGTKVEVMAPVSLRGEMRARAQSVAALYAPPAP